jgi:hypothetical protein
MPETDDLDVVLKLIRKAIKKSPLCADAYSFYCEISQEPPESKIGNLETALYAASIALGEDFQEFAGRFWGFVETRPYMRAKAALADALWESGNSTQPWLIAAKCSSSTRTITRGFAIY